MPPTPEPMAVQTVSVMEVMGENDYSFVSALVNAGTGDEADAKWAATLADIAEWASKVRGKYARVEGKVVLRPSDRATAIRERVRTRYGLTAQVAADVTGEYPGSFAVPVETW